MPHSLCNALQILVCSHYAQFLSRQHLQNEFSCGKLEEICQTMSSNHHHTLIYLLDCAEAETFLKQTILQVLSTTNNAHVKLMTVSYSYPVNFLKAETNNLSAACAISVRGEKMKSEIPLESEDHRRTWLQIQKCVGIRKTEFTGSIDWVRESIVSLSTSARAWKFRCTFKRQLSSYIDLLQKRFGLFYVTEHSQTLDIDLGVTNAQSLCFECVTQPLQIIGSTAQEGNNYASQLSSVYDGNTFNDTSFFVKVLF